MKYKNVTAAAPGWFFVQTDQNQIQEYRQSGPVILRVAAWAINENDEVVGLIGVDPVKAGSVTRLHAPNSALYGEYKHFHDLTQKELQHLSYDPTRPNKANI